MKPAVLTRGILIFILFVSLWGCISSPSSGKRYYQLHMLGDAGGPAHRIEKTLLVEPVEVDSVYDDYRLVYRLSPYELNYYAYEFWTKKPGALVRDAVVDYLSRRGVFKKVITRYAEGDPDLLLQAEIRAIEEYDRADAWFAHLKMTIKIKSLKTDEIVLLRSFDRREKLSEKKVGKVPMALSTVLEEELAILIAQLTKKMN
jgi:ABC-type uncharacterized transport system auxiliary subunit